MVANLLSRRRIVVAVPVSQSVVRLGGSVLGLGLGHDMAQVWLFSYPCGIFLALLAFCVVGSIRELGWA